MRSTWKKTACLMALLLAGSVVSARAKGPDSPEALEGKLAFETGTGPVLDARGKTVTLSAQYSYLFRTLGDKRLRNREVRLEGSLLPDGSFQVESIRLVEQGKLYRIRYFCETCNIAAQEPGNCVCCQHPTELQEYPAGEGENPRPQDVRVLQ